MEAGGGGEGEESRLLVFVFIFWILLSCLSPLLARK